jgi:hypothetical protein
MLLFMSGRWLRERNRGKRCYPPIRPWSGQGSAHARAGIRSSHQVRAAGSKCLICWVDPAPMCNRAQDRRGTRPWGQAHRVRPKIKVFVAFLRQEGPNHCPCRPGTGTAHGPAPKRCVATESLDRRPGGPATFSTHRKVATFAYDLEGRLNAVNRPPSDAASRPQPLRVPSADSDQDN